MVRALIWKTRKIFLALFSVCTAKAIFPEPALASQPFSGSFTSTMEKYGPIRPEPGSDILFYDSK